MTAASHTPSQTPLASASEPFCKVIAPEAAPWSELAHRFCVRVREFTRSEPAQVTPDVLTDADWRDYHLVLLGSIVNNPEILKLYARHQCFTDARYPGRGGVEIRTIVNPLGTGKNVLLLGGTDFPQVNEAVIGLHRSFRDVTFEAEGVLTLRRLNFCASSANQRWVPSEQERERILSLVTPETRLARAADFALFHYQTDHEVWARLFETLIGVSAASPVGPRDAEKLALAWTLVQWSPRFAPEFRDVVDDLLLRFGERIAADWTPVAEGGPISWERTSAALAIRRIGDHFQRTRGRSPFEHYLPVADAAFDVPSSAFIHDGIRDWRATDEWLGVLLETEAYDRIDAADLPSLAQEASGTLASADDLTRRHAANVLTKAAAFHDDGGYLWIRRLLIGDDPIEYPVDAPVPAWNWYTGAYEPDLLPSPPSFDVA